MLHRTLIICVLSLLSLSPQLVSAWTSTTTSANRRVSTATTTKTQLAASLLPTDVSRRDLMASFLPTAAAVLLLSTTTAPTLAFAAGGSTNNVQTLPNGVTYVVEKTGNGPAPERGELVAIRFRAFAGDNKIDDIFDTPEPYYTRVGSGGLIKGVEEALPYMKVGDRWTLTIPSSLAFGGKGRPASAGKPRIPGDVTIVFEVSMEGLPGKEPELIELIGDVE